MAKVWIKKTNDEYEFIVAMGDTARELAEELGTTERAIYSAISHARRYGYKSSYRKVVIDE